MIKEYYAGLEERLGDADEIYLKNSWMPVMLRKIGDASLAIRLSKTDIIVSTPDLLTIDNGGWYTFTTMDRINDYLPHDIQVWQTDYFWYVNGYPYAHGIHASDAGIAGERKRRPRHVRVDGKRMPQFTVPEYIDRVYTTLAYWKIKHIGYTKEEFTGSEKLKSMWKQFRPQVLQILSDIDDTLDDMSTAPNNDELLAAVLNANHIMHVHGKILYDFGMKRGLPKRVVQAVSTGADRYFGWNMLAEFDKRTEIMRIPAYMTKEDYYAERRHEHGGNKNSREPDYTL